MATTNPVPFKRHLPAAIMVSAPALTVLFVLVFFHLMPLWAYLAGSLFVLLGGFALVRRHLADLLAAEALVRSFQDPTQKLAYLPERGWAAGLVAQLSRLRANWSREMRNQYAFAGTFETVLDSLPDPLLLLDEKRRVVRTNLTARKLFGRDLKDRDLAQFLRDPDLLKAVDAVLGGSPGQEVPFESPGPVTRIFLARIEPLPVMAVDDAMALLTFHDVTALKRTEQMRADFVANASHELRTPLATLSGFIETLQGPAKDDAEAHEKFLAIMHEQAARMTRLVQDLLSLSRVEMNELTPPKDAADLTQLLAGIAKTKGEGLVMKMPADFPRVIGDADELTQVFQNLIDNAFKYGRPGGKVTVEARTETKGPMTMGPEARIDCLAVSIQDEGDGIAKEHLPRLTERFYRVDTARSRAMGGTGLGLAIVKHIVNRHRGALQIESEIGKGSRFTVFLPRASCDQNTGSSER
jgi:two-component system phosphate regulon sensor histidine kinase PhoR